MEDITYNLTIIANYPSDNFYTNDLTSSLNKIAKATPLKTQFISAVEVMAVARVIFELQPEVIRIEVWHGIEFIKDIVRPSTKHQIIEVKSNEKK